MSLRLAGASGLGDAEVVEGVDVIRAQPQRFLEMRNGVVKAALFAEGDAEVAVGFRVFGS